MFIPDTFKTIYELLKHHAELVQMLTRIGVGIAVFVMLMLLGLCLMRKEI